MESDLGNLSNWFKANKLTLNLNKSVSILFGPKNRTGHFTVSLNDQSLQNVHETKFLGVWIDDKLSWNIHVNKVLLKVKWNLHLLHNCRNMLNLQTKRIIYFVHIQSHLTYCISIWGNLVSKGTLQKLQKAQDKCISLIDKCKTNKDLNILTIEKLIQLENLKFGFKLSNNLLPKKIVDCTINDQYGKPLKKVHTYGTRYKEIYNLPKAKTQKYLESIFCKGTQSMLTLSPEMRNCPNLKLFVHKCKNLLLTQL